ncbi:hypothetical protein SAMN04515669_0614 [Jiangella sp. DSM 45060]|nr:hypothetical protein SAMN04515669_0614 [Jiangella sp. DSM 45060]
MREVIVGVPRVRADVPRGMLAGDGAVQPADEALSGVDGLAAVAAEAGSAGEFAEFAEAAVFALAGSAGEFAESAVLADAGSAGLFADAGSAGEFAEVADAGSAGEFAETAEFADDGAEEPDDTSATSAAGVCAPLRMGAATALPAPRPSAAIVPTASHVFFWSFIVCPPVLGRRSVLF